MSASSSSRLPPWARKQIVLGLGGVASTDGGAGMVAALGARLLDESGAELPPGGAALARLARIDLSGMADLAGIGVVAATDVDNPLLGERGAAAVYAPQKGASAPDVTCLERGPGPAGRTWPSGPWAG